MGGRLWKTSRPSDGGAYMADALARTPSGRLWVAGSEGWDGSLIARSADKGASWRYASVPTLQYLLGIEAVTGRLGFAAGTCGTLLRTRDGGATWTATTGDVVGPVTRVRPAGTRHGAKTWVRYRVTDARSSRARVTLRIRDGRGHLLKSRPLGWQRTGSTVHRCLFRCDLSRGTYYVKAVATDRAGNPSSRMMAGKLVVR